MKIKKILFIAFGFVLSASILLSCSKTKNSTPTAKLQLQFKSVNTNVTLAGTTAPTIPTISKLSWTEGFVNVTEVHIDGINEDDGKNEIEGRNENSDSPTTSLVNLFTANQQFLNLDVATGNYSNVKFRIGIAQKLTTPALLLKGTFTDSNGAVIPIQFSLNDGNISSNVNGNEKDDHNDNEDNELEIQAIASTLNVNAQNTGTATLNLDFNLLFNGITDVALQATTRVNGQIIIDNINNIAIYNIVKNNLRNFSHIN